MPAEPRYRAVPAAALHRVELDALTAVYDRRSGQTHVLAPPLPELLDALADRQSTLAELVAGLEERYELAGDADATDAVVGARLAELAALGLVEIR